VNSIGSLTDATTIRTRFSDLTHTPVPSRCACFARWQTPLQLSTTTELARPFVTSIADRLLAGALDDGSSVTGRSLKKFFTRAGPEASLDFLRKRHLTHHVAVWLLDAACRGRAGHRAGCAGIFGSSRSHRCPGE
jgi:hypothetical protein